MSCEIEWETENRLIMFQQGIINKLKNEFETEIDKRLKYDVPLPPRHNIVAVKEGDLILNDTRQKKYQ